MEQPTQRKEKQKSESKPQAITFARDRAGGIFELLYDGSGRTSLVHWRGGAWQPLEEATLDDGRRVKPVPASNNLIRHAALLLPSIPEEYGDDQALLSEIQGYIRRYVDVSPVFEAVASYYVLLSWVYDAFAELPYLRLRGDYGSGKTRFLLVIGAICYRPFFASGASTISPIFHTLDAFRGTLVMDEGDFRFTDEKAEIAKILNNGNVQGMPVLRTVIGAKGEYDARAFQVFGPKLIATRGYYDDRALESRFLTEQMGRRPLRADVPLNLPGAYKDEALRLRNKLLLFRFRNLDAVRTRPEFADPTLEPRLNQIFVPLLSLVSDPQARESLRVLARRCHDELRTDRAMDPEAQILEVIRDLGEGRDTVSLKEIASEFVRRHGGHALDQRVSSRWIGNVVRRQLGLRTRKSHGNFVIQLAGEQGLDPLYLKFGLVDDVAA